MNRFLSVGAILAAAGVVAAQQSHVINLGELQVGPGNELIPGGTGFPLQTLGPTLTYTTPPNVIDAADAYQIVFDPYVFAAGTGLFLFTAPLEAAPPNGLGLIFPLRGQVDQFGDFINNVELYLFDAAIDNPGGTLPTETVVREYNVGSQLPLPEFRYTYTVRVNADRSITVTFQDVNLSFQGPMTVANTPTTSPAYPGVTFPATVPLPGGGSEFFGNSTMTISVTNPPAPDQGTATEVRFDNEFDAAYGPAEIRYLDDPGFADGPGDEDGNPILLNGAGQIVPNPQYGLTEAQSSFGTTTSFGLPAIDGEVAAVYNVSAPRSDAAPYVNNRQIGLAVSPMTAAQYPVTVDEDGISGRFIERWTMVWDVYVPSASWDRPTPVAFLNFQPDNGTNSGGQQSADVRINTLTGLASGPKGYGLNRLRVNGDLFDAAAVVGSDFGPDRWMRLAIVCDNSFARDATFYVNGTPVGTIGWGEQLENFYDPANPRYRFLDRGDGFDDFDEPIPDEAIEVTGNFPNPQHDFRAIGQVSGRTVNTPWTSGSFVMFGDALGNGEELFIANYHLAERPFTDAEVAALGGPSAAGIVLDCPLDFDGNGLLAGADYTDYLAALASLLPSANYNKDSTTNAFDMAELFDDTSALTPATGCMVAP